MSNRVLTRASSISVRPSTARLAMSASPRATSTVASALSFNRLYQIKQTNKVTTQQQQHMCMFTSLCSHRWAISICSHILMPKLRYRDVSRLWAAAAEAPRSSSTACSQTTHTNDLRLGPTQAMHNDMGYAYRNVHELLGSNGAQSLELIHIHAHPV